MKVVVKPVYYCDYCGKRYLSEYWGDRHEKGCTMNPNRDCKMCQYVGSSNNIPEILNDIYEQGQHEKLYPKANDILQLTNGCPQCTLTIMRLLASDKRFDDWIDSNGFHETWFYWDYQEACAEFWREYNREFPPRGDGYSVFYG